MKSDQQRALTAFESGRNCAQAVLTGFPELDKELEMALQVAAGFGGGMGGLGGTCGAVTGAFMVLGIHASRKSEDPVQAKEYAKLLVQRFVEKFLRIHGTTECRELTRTPPEGSHIVCNRCITDALLIVEDLS